MGMQDTENKKKALLNALHQTYGNILEACELIDIDRGTYYKWIKNDKDFEAKANEVHKSAKKDKFEFIEAHFKRRVSEGSDACIIFGLKTLGREHGYTEHQEVAITELPKIEVVYKKPIE
jgi:hypothetical protein